MALCMDCPITKNFLALSEEEYRSSGLFTTPGELTKTEVSYLVAMSSLDKATLMSKWGTLLVVVCGFGGFIGLEAPSITSRWQGLRVLMSGYKTCAPYLGGTKLPRKLVEHIISVAPCSMEVVVDQIVGELEELLSITEKSSLETLSNLTKDMPDELLERVGLTRATESNSSATESGSSLLHTHS
jgi:hypothetical protein